MTTCRMADRIASSHALRSIRSIERKEYQDEGAFGSHRGTPSDVPKIVAVVALRRCGG
jgi:hypothetical protein